MERGEEIWISEKLICFRLFQAKEKAGQPPGSKALRKEGLQEVIEELSPSRLVFILQMKRETVKTQSFIFERFKHANNHLYKNFLERNF